MLDDDEAEEEWMDIFEKELERVRTEPNRFFLALGLDWLLLTDNVLLLLLGRAGEGEEVLLFENLCRRGTGVSCVSRAVDVTLISESFLEWPACFLILGQWKTLFNLSVAELTEAFLHFLR